MTILLYLSYLTKILILFSTLIVDIFVINREKKIITLKYIRKQLKMQREIL